MKSNNVGTFKVSATYIGTIVGAGFASGQEVLQFFIAFGAKGFWGVALVTLAFIFYGYTILLLGMKLNAKSHLQVVKYTNGKFLGFFIDIIITIFLFGALAAMIAGAGAIFEEQFGLPSYFGTILMSLITLLTVLKGISGVIKAISYVVPLLLGSVLFVAIYNFLNNPITTAELNYAAALDGASPNWLMSAINYASYNLVIAIAVLAPLGAETKNRRTLRNGAILGGLGLGVGIIAIYYSVLTNIIESANLEIPMIYSASKIAAIFQIVFSIVLFAEVYTTAVGSLYGFVQRFIPKESRYKKLLIAISIVLAFGVSQFGFSNMVKYLYPAVGYGGIIMLLGLTWIWVAKRDILKNDKLIR